MAASYINLIALLITVLIIGIESRPGPSIHRFRHEIKSSEQLHDEPEKVVREIESRPEPAGSQNGNGSPRRHVHHTRTNGTTHVHHYGGRGNTGNVNTGDNGSPGNVPTGGNGNLGNVPTGGNGNPGNVPTGGNGGAGNLPGGGEAGGGGNGAGGLGGLPGVGGLLGGEGAGGGGGAGGGAGDLLGGLPGVGGLLGGGGAGGGAGDLVGGLLGGAGGGGAGGNLVGGLPVVGGLLGGGGDGGLLGGLLGGGGGGLLGGLLGGGANSAGATGLSGTGYDVEDRSGNRVGYRKRGENCDYGLAVKTVNQVSNGLFGLLLSLRNSLGGQFRGPGLVRNAVRLAYHFLQNANLGADKVAIDTGCGLQEILNALAYGLNRGDLTGALKEGTYFFTHGVGNLGRDGTEAVQRFLNGGLDDIKQGTGL